MTENGKYHKINLLLISAQSDEKWVQHTDKRKNMLCVLAAEAACHAVPKRVYKRRRKSMKKLMKACSVFSKALAVIAIAALLVMTALWS